MLDFLNNTAFLTIITTFLVLILVIVVIKQIWLFRVGMNKFTMINNVHSGKQSVKVMSVFTSIDYAQSNLFTLVKYKQI